MVWLSRTGWGMMRRDPGPKMRADAGTTAGLIGLRSDLGKIMTLWSWTPLVVYSSWGPGERRGSVRSHPGGRLPRLGCQTVPQGPG